MAGQEAGKAQSVSNFLNKANTADSIYAAIVATNDASEALNCVDGQPGSVFDSVCLLIASSLELLAEEHMLDRELSVAEAERVWIQLGGDIDGEAAFDNSGRSVALSSDGLIMAVGAPYNDGGGSSSGHVRVFRRNSVKAPWIQLGGDIDGEAAGDQSGYSLALSSDGLTLAIGAPFNDAGTGSASDNRGHVRVYGFVVSGQVLLWYICFCTFH